MCHSGADRDVAVELQRKLERFATPWYRRKTLSVFREQTELAARPSVSYGTPKAIDESEYFILVASPHAAASKFVNRKLEYFLKTHSLEKLLIVLTEGNVEWNPDNDDFDWNRTDAIPSALKGQFRSEPLFVDLRDQQDRHLVRTNVARIAAALHNVSLRPMVFRERRRTMGAPIRWFRSVWNAIRRKRQTPLNDALQRQDVALGVSAPRSACRNDQFSITFAAYVEEEEEVIASKLRALSRRSETHLGLQVCSWQLDTNVCVRVHGQHLIVEPKELHFVWRGKRIVRSFDIRVDEDAPECTTVISLDVLIAEIVVARLRVDLEIISKRSDNKTQSLVGYAARSAFASYASPDRMRVLDRMSEIQKTGMDVFLDCLSLHPGETWKPKLEQEIQCRDVLLLFWSIHAKTSQWVEWEWRRALHHKGLQGIEPHPLDPVDEAKPPDELSDLQFSDRHMLIRRYYELSQETRK